MVRGLFFLLGASGRQLQNFSAGSTRQLRATLLAHARAFDDECRAASVAGGPSVQRGVFTPLVAARVALPSSRPVARLLDSLPPNVASLLTSRSAALASGLLVDSPPAEVASAALRPKRACGSSSEVEEFYRRALDSGLARDLGSTTVRGRVGLFALTKSDSADRNILDCVSVNRLWSLSGLPSLSLPTPEDLANLSVSSHGRLVVSKLDLHSFYNSFLLPDWLHAYFVLPRLSDAAMRRLGVSELAWTGGVMGWNLQVVLAQLAHLHVARSAVERIQLLPVSGSQRHLCVDHAPGQTVLGVYIDDVFQLSLRPSLAREVNDQLLAAYAAHQWQVSWAKFEEPSSRPTTVLGMDILPDSRVIRPSPGRSVALLRATHACLQAAVVSGDELRSLIGKWVWVLLLCRPLLSVLSASFAFIGWAVSARPLWASVRRELQSLCDLLPFVRVALNRPWSPLVCASDACSSGGGVVYAVAGPRAAESLARRLPPFSPAGASLAAAGGLRDPLSDVTRLHWRTAVAAPWRWRGAHINALEAEAAVMQAIWLAKHPAASGCRVTVLQDSMVAGGAAVRGRSSSAQLRGPLRRLAAWQLLGNFRLQQRWVPTTVMPADRASRLFEPVEREFMKRTGAKGGDGSAGDGPWFAVRLPRIPLLLEALAPATRLKYARSMVDFERFAAASLPVAHWDRALGRMWLSSNTALDEFMLRYISRLRLSGLADSRVAGLLWAFRRYNPQLPSTTLPMVYACVKALDKLHIRQSALPLSMDLLRFVCLASKPTPRRGLYCLASLLAFDCLLRSAEVLKLRARDVLFPPLGGLPTLVLEWTKTGGKVRQFVKLRRSWLAELLAVRCQQLGRDDCLFPISKSSFRLWFSKATLRAGLSGRFTLHTFRVGGATELLLLGWELARIKLAGRWRSDSSLFLYLQQGKLALLELGGLWFEARVGRSMRLVLPRLVALWLQQRSAVPSDGRTGGSHQIR